MKAKVLVYHNSKGVAKFEFTNVAGMPREEFIDKALDKAFELTNSIDSNWWEGPAAIGEAKNGCRSTMEGDMMTVHIDKTLAVYKVASTGFQITGGINSR